MHRNESRQESNQALLSRVRKQMDEPRMAESMWKEREPDPGTMPVVSYAFGSAQAMTNSELQAAIKELERLSDNQKTCKLANADSDAGRAVS